MNGAAPTALSLVIAAGMVYLAGGPLERRGAPPEEATEESVLFPSGDHERFPSRFEWPPVPGADLYEVTVSAGEGEALFRQQGTGTLLQVGFDPGALPGPGEYVWEVVAFGNGRSLARATARFRVTGGS